MLRLTVTVLENEEHERLEARLMLIRGEAKYLFDELDAAQTLADSAMLAFVDLADAIGLADSHYLQSYIAIGRGNAARRHAERNAVRSCGLTGTHIGWRNKNANRIRLALLELDCVQAPKRTEAF